MIMRLWIRRVIKAELRRIGILEDMESLLDDRDHLMIMANDNADDISRVSDKTNDIDVKLNAMEARLRMLEKANPDGRLKGIALDEADNGPRPEAKTCPEGMMQGYPPINVGPDKIVELNPWDAPVNLTREQITLALDDALSAELPLDMADKLHDVIMKRLIGIEIKNNEVTSLNSRGVNRWA